MRSWARLTSASVENLPFRLEMPTLVAGGAAGPGRTRLPQQPRGTPPGLLSPGRGPRPSGANAPTATTQRNTPLPAEPGQSHDSCHRYMGKPEFAELSNFGRAKVQLVLAISSATEVVAPNGRFSR